MGIYEWPKAQQSGGHDSLLRTHKGNVTSLGLW